VMKKIADLTLEELQEKKDKLEKRINEKRYELEIIQKSLMPMISEMRTIDESIDEKALSIEDPSNFLEMFPETKVKRKLTEEYLKSLNLFYSGSYWTDTNQSVVRIQLYKNDNEYTEKVRDGILEVLPYIKIGENGRKRFSIFEYTLSYSHSYYLEYEEDKKMFHLADNRHYVRSSSEDLMEVLKYIQLNHYYEKER